MQAIARAGEGGEKEFAQSRSSKTQLWPQRRALMATTAAVEGPDWVNWAG